MSVAFTREEDVEAAAAHLPDRPVSPHPNLVTASGLKALDAALAAAREAYAAAQASGAAGSGIAADRSAMARAARDLRYFLTRRASAQLTEPDRSAGTVVFGSRVTFERPDGQRRTYRIVGEDEADAGTGTVSYVSPLARALMGKVPGDTALLAGAELEVLEVAPG